LIGKKYNEILQKLEKDMENVRDLNLAKSAISELSLVYIDELTKNTESYTNKIANFEARLADLEKKFHESEYVEELHLKEKIACPYCNYEFFVEYDDTNQEITCPKCNNLIELDWGEFEDDM
jgi:DNA repair exonuclease SbcCD ATPase subunit